jgi:hypothetical protein
MIPKHVLLRPLPCLLCGRPPRYNGIFVPKPPARFRFGTPPGKTRLFRYSLCRRCHRKRGVGQRVEAKLLADLAELAAKSCRPGAGQPA